MNRYLAIFRDLIGFLPGQTPTAWEVLEEVVEGKPIIIFIPGFQARPRPLSILRKRFRRDGYSVLVLSMDWLSLSDGVSGLYRMAKRLSEVILTLRKSVGMNRRVYLVGHSAGGLVARYYTQLLGGYHYCDGIVTLGTPHRGSWYAALGFFSLLIVKARCLFQMLPVSPFIKRLNNAYYPKKFKMISISSSSDYFSGPELSRLAPEQGREYVEDVVISGVSHNGLLLNKQVYELVLSKLGLESPAGKPKKRAGA